MLKWSIFAGAAVGTLVGLTLGMSINPVASVLLTGLSAALVTILGLTTTQKGMSSDIVKQHHATVAAFGVAAVLAAVLGVSIRTHDWLAPPPVRQRAQLEESGLSKEDIRLVLLYRQIGVRAFDEPPITLPDLIKQLHAVGLSDRGIEEVVTSQRNFLSDSSIGGKKKPLEEVHKEKDVDSSRIDPSHSGFFANEMNACQVFTNSKTLKSNASRLGNLEQLGGPYLELAKVIHHVPDDQKQQLMDAIGALVCADSRRH